MDSYFQNLSASVDPVIEDMGVDSEAVVQDILDAINIEQTYCNLNETRETIQETAEELDDSSFPNIVCRNDCKKDDSGC